MVKYESAENLRLFIKAGGIGFVLGFLFTLKDILSGVKKDRIHIKAVFDIIFAVIAGVISFLFILSENNGLFRWFAVIGECIGFLLFLLIPGRAVLGAYLFLSGKISAMNSRIRGKIIAKRAKHEKARMKKAERRKKRKKHPKKVNKTIAT